MTRVIVVVEGGVVQSVFSNDPTLSVDLLDHDVGDDSIKPLVDEIEENNMKDVLVTAKRCPDCGNYLQHFVHNCPNSSDHPEKVGCPACDDDCPNCT
jgi:hypothetical protein